MATPQGSAGLTRRELRLLAAEEEEKEGGLPHAAFRLLDRDLRVGGHCWSGLAEDMQTCVDMSAD